MKFGRLSFLPKQPEHNWIEFELRIRYGLENNGTKYQRAVLQ